MCHETSLLVLLELGCNKFTALTLHSHKVTNATVIGIMTVENIQLKFSEHSFLNIIVDI
jgi:hypothetical protein